MPWIMLREALDLIGHDKKDKLHWALLAGDVKSRERHEDGTVRNLHPSLWTQTVDWENYRLAVEESYGIIWIGPGAPPPPPPTIYFIDVEIDQASLSENFPCRELTRDARQPAIDRKGQPTGLEDWYVNEHIPAGYSTRDQDLAAARERFGRWTKDKEALRQLRREYAPDSWGKPGPRDLA
jgi:hypothetical protein